MRPVTERSIGRRRAPEDVSQSTPGLDIVSHPVDSYVAPPPQAPKELNSFLVASQALQSFTSDFTKYREDRKQENVRQAQMDAMAGKYNKPNSLLNFGEGYDTTFHFTLGEKLGKDAKAKYLQSLQENNFFVDSKDPEAEKKTLYDSIIKGTFTDPVNAAHPYTRFGASEQLHEALREGDVIFRKAHFEKGREDILTSLGGNIRGDVTDILGSGAAPEEKAKQIRGLSEMYFDLVKDNPTLGITRSDMSNMLVTSSIGVFNDILNDIKEGRVDSILGESQARQLLDGLESPDATGIRLSDVKNSQGALIYQDEFNRLHNSLVATQEWVDKRADKLSVKRYEVEYGNAFRDLLMNSNGKYNFTTAKTELDDRFANGRINGKDYAVLAGQLDNYHNFDKNILVDDHLFEQKRAEINQLSSISKLDAYRKKVLPSLYPSEGAHTGLNHAAISQLDSLIESRKNDIERNITEGKEARNKEYAQAHAYIESVARSIKDMDPRGPGYVSGLYSKWASMVEAAHAAGKNSLEVAHTITAQDTPVDSDFNKGRFGWDDSMTLQSIEQILKVNKVRGLGLLRIYKAKRSVIKPSSPAANQ